jgi:hypothetical protein
MNTNAITEIKRNIDRMSVENCDASNGMHISTYHVGVSVNEMVHRSKIERKKIVSSFHDMETANACLEEMFNDDYFLSKDLSSWLADNSVERGDFEFCSFDRDDIGYVMSNGNIRRTNCFKVCLTKKIAGGYDRDLNTGMPFSLITMYPVEE